ncbi:hypothetical protein HS041_12440 [Planomonospora sp. ID67723]|uniref:hypothetical protein n=1 Tax=Planomonospora sp. ID67723 TaxID=2738134 RepID=UPI0018C3E93A|nr:hypothetical protein [Planomonospora sp. ID67723]MBG0828578.1 hypothetical protein [Planomonospora sp. ID67723]
MDAGLIVLALLTAWYLISCLVYPFKPCPICGRGGEVRSTSYPGAFGNCRICKGSGRRRRTGARLLGRGR